MNHKRKAFVAAAERFFIANKIDPKIFTPSDLSRTDWLIRNAPLAMLHLARYLAGDEGKNLQGTRWVRRLMCGIGLVKGRNLTNDQDRIAYLEATLRRSDVRELIQNRLRNPNFGRNPRHRPVADHATLRLAQVAIMSQSIPGADAAGSKSIKPPANPTAKPTAPPAGLNSELVVVGHADPNVTDALRLCDHLSKAADSMQTLQKKLAAHPEEVGRNKSAMQAISGCLQKIVTLWEMQTAEGEETAEAKEPTSYFGGDFVPRGASLNRIE